MLFLARIVETRISIVAIFLSVLVVLTSRPAVAAPSSELWDRWLTHDETSTAEVDHGVWSGLLRKFVSSSHDGINRVSYRRFADADKLVLSMYLEDLSEVGISTLNRAEQRAYWVNLYNALTVQVVLNAGPVATIRDIDISPGFFADGPWGKALITIEGEELALDDIEHRILRPIWKDPRIHYALNCASLGCPNLLAIGMTAENGEKYLEKAAIEFISHPRAVKIANGNAEVSSIYKWFSDDFGNTEEELLNHLKSYASKDLAAALGSVKGVDYQSYDWTLNSTTIPAPTPPKTPKKPTKRGS